MATIGTFTAQGDGYTGSIKTLTLNIEALADAAGLSYSYVGELERGRRNPTLRVVERLAKALEVSPYSLLRTAGSGA